MDLDDQRQVGGAGLGRVTVVSSGTPSQVATSPRALVDALDRRAVVRARAAPAAPAAAGAPQQPEDGDAQPALRNSPSPSHGAVLRLSRRVRAAKAIAVVPADGTGWRTCLSTAGSSASARPSACFGAPVSGPSPARRAKLARRLQPPRRGSLADPPEGRARPRGPGARRRGRLSDRARSTPTATTCSGGSTGWSARARPFEERMALIWHDWFATADVDSQQLSIEQARALPRAGPPARSSTCCSTSPSTRRC